MNIHHTAQAWQAMFQPASMLAGTLQGSARSFWNGQNDVLDEMQNFTEEWFKRRQAGTRAALEACESMCAARTPVEWLAAYHKWLVGATERLMADGLACQNEVGKLSEVLGPSLVPSSDDRQGDGAREVTNKRMRARTA
jgi:hypothetical protein